MATKLENGSKIKRIIRVHGVGDVEITMSQDGFAFRVPGTKISTTLSLGAAVADSQTPANVASYHFGKPVEFLKAQTGKVAKSKAERESA